MNQEPYDRTVRAPRGANQLHRALCAMQDDPEQWVSAYWFALAVRRYERKEDQAELARSLRDLVDDLEGAGSETRYRARYDRRSAAGTGAPHGVRNRAQWRAHLIDVLDQMVGRGRPAPATTPMST